jgi:integrase
LNTQEWVFKVRHPKGEGIYGSQRVVPIPDKLQPVCIRYLKAREAELAARGAADTERLVFAMKDAGTPLNPCVLGQWVKRVSDRTGIKFSPHGLRRTYGQILLDRGASIETVSVMLGHTSTLTTERHYCRKNADSARLEALRALQGHVPGDALNYVPSENSFRLTPVKHLPGYA